MAAVLSLVRPLLGIAEDAADRDAARPPILHIADDPTNSDPVFTRARLRASMPVLAREGLSAERLGAFGKARRAHRGRFVRDAPRRVPVAGSDAVAVGRAVAVDADAVSRLPDEIALRMLGRPSARSARKGRSNWPSSKISMTGLSPRSSFLDCSPQPARFAAASLAQVSQAGRQVLVEKRPGPKGLRKGRSNRRISALTTRKTRPVARAGSR